MCLESTGPFWLVIKVTFYIVLCTVHFNCTLLFDFSYIDILPRYLFYDERTAKSSGLLLEHYPIYGTVKGDRRLRHDDALAENGSTSCALEGEVDMCFLHGCY